VRISASLLSYAAAFPRFALIAELFQKYVLPGYSLVDTKFKKLPVKASFAIASFAAPNPFGSAQYAAKSGFSQVCHGNHSNKRE
jgi:hypothetical protein